MTKDEELAMDLALAALEVEQVAVTLFNLVPKPHITKAITAIKQARSAPVQEPVAWMYEDMMGLVGVRVQKEKPIVARPVTPLCLCTPPAAQPTTEEFSAVKPAAPVQEPVHQWRQKHSPYWYDGYPDNDDGGGPYETRILYTTPPAQPAPVQEPDAFDGGVYLGDGKDHAIKHHVSYKPAQQKPDHGDELTIAYMSGVHRGKELAVAQAVPDAFGTREGEHPQYIQGWNDCRAEMLSMRKRVKP
jgi:hypothetical protein